MVVGDDQRPVGRPVQVEQPERPLLDARVDVRARPGAPPRTRPGRGSARAPPAASGSAGRGTASRTTGRRRGASAPGPSAPAPAPGRSSSAPAGRRGRRRAAGRPTPGRRARARRRPRRPRPRRRGWCARAPRVAAPRWATTIGGADGARRCHGRETACHDDEGASGPLLVPRGVPPRVLGGGPGAPPHPLRGRRARPADRAGRHHAEPRLVHGSHPGDDPDPPGAPLHGARAVLPDPGPRRAHALGPRLPGPGGRGRQPGRPPGAPDPAPGGAARDLSRGRPLARRPASSRSGPGAFRLALAAEAPVVPVTIVGAFEAWPARPSISRVRAGSRSPTTRRSTGRPSRPTPTGRRGPSS